MRLKAIMTKPVEAIAPSALIKTAERRLRSMGIHHLVVVDHGTVVGLVTTETLSNRQAEGARRVGDAMIRNIAVATPEMTVRQAAALDDAGACANSSACRRPQSPGGHRQRLGSPRAGLRKVASALRWRTRESNLSPRSLRISRRVRRGDLRVRSSAASA